jgi:acetyl esterase
MSSTDPRLHPDVRAVLAALEEEGGPPLETQPVAEARRLSAEALKPMEGEPEPVGTIQDLRIPGPAGEIPVRVYTPDGNGPFPGLVYFHGGGWVLCDLDTHDVVCRAIARRAPAVVVAVDYRLAPEHKFPAAVEDSFAATRWVSENAARLKIDRRRVAVGGDSAGGNLSAVVALKSRRSGPNIALQVMVYPVTDLSSFDTTSYRDFADGYHLTKSEMEWFRREYLSNPAQASDPDVSPLLAADVYGAPPALVITAECDVLRDEGEAYAERLRQAGVPVTLTRYPGMIHPFFSLSGAIREGAKALDQVADAIRGMPHSRNPASEPRP